jgi:hypothetical protein
MEGDFCIFRHLETEYHGGMKVWLTLVLLLGALSFLPGQSLSEPPQADGPKVLLQAGLVSAPSREGWLGAGAGLRLHRHRWMIHLLFLELADAPRWSFPANNYQESAALAGAISHGMDLWRRQRWTFFWTSMFQLQRINVFDWAGAPGFSRNLLRSYPRVQLSTGMGVKFRISEWLYAMHAFRYGIAWGEFFLPPPHIADHRLGMAIEIGLGVEL